MISQYHQFLFIIFYMYIVQGLPYGIQAKFLPIYLRTRGFSLSTLGMMKLLYLPLIMRTLYAPIINVYLSIKHWLQISVLLLFFNFLSISLLKNFDFTHLVINFVAMNFLCSIQDVSLDSLTMSVLKDNNVNEGNVAQVVGYKIGALIGGGIMITFSQFLSWFQLFLITGLFYAFGVLLTVISSGFSDEFTNSFTVFEHVQIMEVQNTMSFMNYLKIYKNSINDYATCITICYLLIYKMGEQGATNMLPLFLIDKKQNIGEIGLWIGIVGQIISLFGSAYAVVYVKHKRSTYTAVRNLCLTVAPFITILTILISKQFNSSFPRLVFPLCVVVVNCLNLISGILTTATFTMMMQCSQKVPVHLQSTHYTILATVEVLGKLLFTSTVGLFTDEYGYQYSYILFSILAWVTSLFLILFHNAFEYSIFLYSYRPRSICIDDI